jgi:hypothetical protein
LTIIVTVRIPATLEQVERAERADPNLYQQVIELAIKHGLRSHRRVYREGELLDIDEWESESARDGFLKEATPLLDRIRAARGSGPSTTTVWTPLPDPSGALRPDSVVKHSP